MSASESIIQIDPTMTAPWTRPTPLFPFRSMRRARRFLPDGAWFQRPACSSSPVIAWFPRVETCKNYQFCDF